MLREEEVDVHCSKFLLLELGHLAVNTIAAVASQSIVPFIIAAVWLHVFVKLGKMLGPVFVSWHSFANSRPMMLITVLCLATVIDTIPIRAPFQLRK